MPTIKEKEQNLFNATETLAQFYDEIESFLDILHSNMQRAGYALKGERLRSGTQIMKNLSRRLLATATVIYLKGVGDTDEVDEDEQEEKGEIDTAKLGKREVSIAADLRIPFVHITLFEPKTLPSARTLTSPTVNIGCVGDMSFVVKRSENTGQPDSPVLSISNLASIHLRASHKLGDSLRLNCWSPARMNKFKMIAKLVGFHSHRLLDIDSQEKIRTLSEQLVEFSA